MAIAAADVLRGKDESVCWGSDCMEGRWDDSALVPCLLLLASPDWMVVS